MRFPWNAKLSSADNDVGNNTGQHAVELDTLTGAREGSSSFAPGDVEMAERQCPADKPCQELDRGNWGGRFDFIMTCIGYAVGLGNVWRFPYLCYSNGGGAFLIPYCIMLIILGLPIFFLEFAFGQFASLGPISVWSISPLFKGIGFGMILMSWILVIYYQVIVAHCMFYLTASFTATLPWTQCGQWWNSDRCSIGNITGLQKSSSDEYFYRRVLRFSGGLDDPGDFATPIAIALFIAWVICCLVLIKGVQSLGKVAYFTSTFPYVMLTILFIRSVFQKGAWDGIVFYVKPDFTKLTDPKVWTDAATQIFFSLGCCNGSLIAMSSFNKFRHNCCRDAIIVAIINCATSVYAGFVIFANLGYMAAVKKVGIEKVAREGPGLAFIVYPEALANMPFSSLWSILFFLMMCCLGFGTEFSLLETVISGLQDELRRCGVVFTRPREIAFRIGICVFNFLAGLPMVWGNGYYLLSLVDDAVAGYPLLLLCFFEVIVICHVYGLRQFRRDIELMINSRPNWYWRIMWLAVAPAVSLGLIIFKAATGKDYTMDGYEYPVWAYFLQRLISVAAPLFVPLWFGYKYCREGGFILLRESLKPSMDWGPARFEDRADFLQKIHTRVLNKSAGGRGSQITTTGIIPVNASSALQLGSSGHQLTGSAVSGLAEVGVMHGTGFFASKLSVAEKLTQQHAKDIVKRVASQADVPNTTESQLNLAPISSSNPSYLAGQSQLAKPLAALGILSSNDDDQADDDEGTNANSSSGAVRNRHNAGADDDDNSDSENDGGSNADGGGKFALSSNLSLTKL